MKQMNIVFKTTIWCSVALFVMLITSWQVAFAFGEDIVDGFYNIGLLLFAFLDNTIGTFILESALGFLRWATTYTILEFNSIIAPAGEGVVQSIWLFFRDLANLVIVALFLTIAIGIAFSHLREKPGWYSKTTLIRLLIAALLVNFSGFFVLLIYDISNLFAFLFFERAGLGDPNLGSDLTKPLSENESGFIIDDEPGQRGIIFHLFSLIAKVVLAVSFAYLVVLFLERFLVAIMVLVTSPIAVVALFSGGDNNLISKFRKWWVGKLQSTALMPVIIFFLLWFVFSVRDLVFNDLTDTVASSPEQKFSVGIFGLFVFIVFLLYAISLFQKISKSVGEWNDGNGLSGLMSRWWKSDGGIVRSLGEGRFNEWRKKSFLNQATKSFARDVRSNDQNKSLRDRHTLFKSSIGSTFLNRIKGGKKSGVKPKQKDEAKPKQKDGGRSESAALNREVSGELRTYNANQLQSLPQKTKIIEGTFTRKTPGANQLQSLPQKTRLALPFRSLENKEIEKVDTHPPTGKVIDKINFNNKNWYHTVLGTSDKSSLEEMRGKYKKLMETHSLKFTGKIV